MQLRCNKPFALPVALLLAFGLFLGAARDTKASDVQLVGTASYSYLGLTAVLKADQVANYDAFGYSGTLRLELWAFSSPFTGGSTLGYKLAQYSVGTLTAGFHYSNLNSGTIGFIPPPDGTWYFSMLLTEYIGSGADDGYATRDWINFPTPVVFGAPPPPPPPSVSPQPGIWSNPSESGTGYTIDFKHGVLVVVFYSFQASGAPQWYISSGPLVGNTFTGTLDKFVSGQCISASCPYHFPSGIGNDGTVTIIFSSNTSGTMYLPGGRTIPISPTAF